MDIDSFHAELVTALNDSGLFNQVDIDIEEFVLHGRAHLDTQKFLQVHFNSQADTTSFSLIDQEKRTWGIDNDHRRGWHRHPIENPDDHITVEPLTVSQIIKELVEVLSSRP